jgi:hypothetical protein
VSEAAEGLERAGAAVEPDGSAVVFQDVDGNQVRVLARD